MGYLLQYETIYGVNRDFDYNKTIYMGQKALCYN